jgi:tetratricopeptide (TPR) repeat protein
MSKKSVAACLHLLLFVLFLPSPALAWTPGLKEAAEAFALGKATPAQEMMVFYQNYEINLLAQEGKISKSTYRNCQEEFFELNEGFANKAVRDAGFDPSISNRKYNPGTDTDVNVLGKGGKKVSLGDIKKIDGNYQKIVQDHFRRKGLKPLQGGVQTETDFMPHPKHTDPEEFQKIVDYVNQNGGTAYKDPRAASAQSKLGTTQPMSIDEASSFSSTMKDFADTKINKANALRSEAKSIRGSNPGRAEYLEAKARQFDYQAAKYHNRIDAANNHLRRQNGLPENPRNITGFQQSADIIELSGRNPFTGKDASTIRNLHQSALQSSTDDMIDTLVDIARQNPSQAAQIQKALGKEINRLPANRAGQAIERIENATKGIKGLDKSLATGAVAEARMLKQAGAASTKWASFKNRMKNVTGINRMTKFSVFMSVGSAVIIGHQGVTITLNNVKATDTLWDYFRNCYYHSAWEGTGIGPAFEQAQREEIERYMKEFEAKQSPSMVKHVTFTLLKTGTYMGRDALIGMLYLPDTIWEYFTQEKEMEAYAAMQNELAGIMRQMIKDQREFNQIMADMKKMGLHDSDAKPYLDCLCAGCGGSLGGFFNPGCTSDIGHGPCQCNGPLTIWKTPLPAGNKEAQYDCFNKVAKMRYEEARAIFDKWRQQMIDENAKSVQPELDAIMEDIASRKAMEDENTARDISDRFEAIKELLLPQDVDTVRAMVGPYLQNHAVKNLETGDIDRAVDNQDRALNKIGARSSQQKSDMTQRKVQYERWAESWREIKSKKFREIDELIRKKQTERAKGEIETLEYRMLKDPTRFLPPAVKDPAFLALKERVTELRKRYEQAMQDMWAKVKPLGPDREHRLAIPILEKALEEWEHPHHAKEGLERQLGYHRAELKRAEDKKKLGQHYEKNKELAHAVREYEESLRIQKDNALERDLARLRSVVQKQNRAKELWAEAQRLQQGQYYAEAIKKYKEGLAIWTDPAIQDRVASLEKFLADRKKQEAAKASQAAQSGAGKSSQAVAKPTALTPASTPAPAQPEPPAPKAVPAVVPASTPDAGQVQGVGAQKAQSGGFAGQWETEWGVLVLDVASGSGQVKGTYPHDAGQISGQLSSDGSVLTGTWSEAPTYKPPRDAGRIEFVLASDANSFIGKWGYSDLDMTGTWDGKRWTGDQAKSAPSEQEVAGAVSTTGKGGTAGGSANTPQGWQSVTIGNVSFAVPASWQYKTVDESDVEMLHLYWDGSFDAPLHGVSGGIATDFARAKSDLSGSRVVRLGGAEVLRADDGPTMNLLFPPMSDNRGVALVVFRGPDGDQATIDAVLATFRVGGQGDADAQRSASPEVSLEVGNIHGVQNGPTQPTVVTLNSPRVLALITNYHWNNARGATPGTIALRDAQGKVHGPWRAEGSPGQGGVPNAYWTARPMALLPAGTYTVVDSAPATWAHNGQSGGKGFTRVETLPASGRADTPAAPSGPEGADAALGAALAGTWDINANGYVGKIEFQQAGGRITGRLWFKVNSVWEELQDVSFDGVNLTFIRPIPRLDQRYSGVLSGSEVRGSFTQAGSGNYVWWMKRGPM